MVRKRAWQAAGPTGRGVVVEESVPCALCGARSTALELAETGWLSPEALDRLGRKEPRWRREDGACPACVQHLLLETLLEKGEAALHESVQQAWPLAAAAS